MDPTTNDLIIEQLREIKKLAASNDKASQVLKRDMTAVKKHLAGINGTTHRHENNFNDLWILLKGDTKDKEDAGLVGEHITMRRYICDELKPSIAKLRWFFISSMLSVLIVGALAGYIYVSSQ